MLPHIFVFRPDEAQPQQEGAEGKGGVFADLGFPHDGPALVDGLRGDGQRQRDIRPYLTGVEGAFKTAPFQRTPVEYGMKVQGVISRPVVMFVAFIPPAVPFPLEAFHGGIGGKLADFFQHGFPHLLAPAFHPVFIDIEGFEQDVLFGIHDGEGVFQALRGMLGGVHMDVHPTASVHDSPCMAQGANNLLQLSHFAVFQLGRVHLHLIGAIAYGKLLPPDPMRSMDAGVVDKPPFLALVVYNLPRIVGAGFVRLTGHGAEQGCHCFRRLLAGYPSHLNFAAEVLVF